MEFQVTGKITKFLDVQSGTSKATGNEWQKQEFVLETEDQYNNLYCFEVFGAEKVENLTKFQKVGETVTVKFNVGCNEWKGKYFTSLSAWRIEKGSAETPDPINENANFETVGDTPEPAEQNDLPF